LPSCRTGCARSRPALRTRSPGRQPWRGQVTRLGLSCRSKHWLLVSHGFCPSSGVCHQACSRRLGSKLSSLVAGYKWVLLKEGQEPAPRDPAPPGSERAQSGNGSGSGAGSGDGEPGYLAGAGIEGGLGRGPEADRLRDMLRHRDDQLASLQDQLRQLESTRDRWGALKRIA